MNGKALFGLLLSWQLIIFYATIAQEKKAIPVHIICVQEKTEGSKALHVLLFHSVGDDSNVYKGIDTDTQAIPISRNQTAVEKEFQVVAIDLIIQQSTGVRLVHRKLFVPRAFIYYEPDASEGFIFFPIAFIPREEEYIFDPLKGIMEEKPAQYDAVKLIPLQTEYVSHPVELQGHPELENIVVNPELNDMIWINGSTLNAIKWLAGYLGKKGFAVSVTSGEHTPPAAVPHSWLDIPSGKTLLFYNNSEPFYEFTNFQKGYSILMDHNVRWPTTEHYYQAMKFTDKKMQASILHMRTPREAFDFAQQNKNLVRPDWQQENLWYMMNAVKNKFYQHKQIADMLVATYPRVLVENAGKNDDFYGAGAEGKGKNHLGKILMKVRAALRKGISQELLAQLTYDEQDRQRTWVDFANGDNEDWYKLPVIKSSGDILKEEKKEETKNVLPESTDALATALQKLTEAFNVLRQAL